MNYKPDKFDRVAVRIVTIVISLVFVVGVIVLFMIKFSSHGEEIFTIENLKRAGFMLAIISLLGISYAMLKKDDKDD